MRSIFVRRLVLAGAIAAALGTAAQAQVANRFVHFDADAAAKVSRLPPSLDTTPVSVVVMLSGESVASAQAKAGTKLAQGVKSSIKAQRIIEQDMIRPEIEARGGRVIGSFQSALNGIKVRIARSQIADLKTIPGVVSVKLVNIYQRDNLIGIPRVQAPSVWAFPGFHGEHVKVAVIDTGIDYTHANFGGPGTVAAYNAALATDTLPANPALFGPNAPKVKGGVDLAGDDYNADPGAATYQPIPHPDLNPLDCNLDAAVGHGSHVSGTIAGFGVLSSGQTYTGAYDSTTYNSSFRIGPGVAPKADLYAVRVFGCVGSTDLVGEALEWAIDNDMDVVNMSLGASFGTGDTADAEATDNAVKAGIVVVASAGNDNDLRYITGTPASATRAISVAATDTPATVPFGNFAMPAAGGDPASTISALDANGYPFTSPLTLTVKVLKTGTAVGLGCSVAEFQANGGVVGKLAVVNRGTCGRVAKAIYGQMAGAAAVVQINNAASLPPYEGQIFQNPDNGAFFDVTIPFFGVVGTTAVATSDGSRLVLRDGLPITITQGPSKMTGTATFSSGGPRNGDSFLKPDVAAPGSPIISTLVGSGNLQESLSGTSMSSPHVAGIAALVRQANPTWAPALVKAAIINGTDPSVIANYATHTAGAGFVNAVSSARTRVVAFGDRQATHVNFGLQEFAQQFTQEMTITLRNDGSIAAQFDVSVTNKQGSPHTVSLDKTSVKVNAKSTAQVQMTINVPAATAGNSDDFRDAAGLVKFTPLSVSDNAGIALSVPYYLVPRVMSNLVAKLDKPITPSSTSANMLLSNTGSAIAATADFYTWGLKGTGFGAGNNGGFDLSSAGVQTFVDGGQLGIAFAVNMEQAWSSPSTREFDVYIDTDGDGIADYILVGIDIGLITTGLYDGRIAAAVYKKNASGGFDPTTIDYLANASTDSSSIVLPVLASSIGITAANPHLIYDVVAFDDQGNSDVFPFASKFNAFTPAISNGQFVSVAKNGNASVPVVVNFTELAISPALGILVLTPDNQNGAPEANLVPLN